MSLKRCSRRRHMIVPSVWSAKQRMRCRSEGVIQWGNTLFNIYLLFFSVVCLVTCSRRPTSTSKDFSVHIRLAQKDSTRNGISTIIHSATQKTDDVKAVIRRQPFCFPFSQIRKVTFKLSFSKRFLGSTL